MTPRLVLGSCFLLAGCVVGATARPTRLETSRATGEPPGGGVLEVGDRPACAGVHPSTPPRPAPDAVWIDGYCHFDGADFVWVAGRWERPRRALAGGTWK